ncbi:MAG: hypothetical protein CMA49_00495 [Euryarchaeota archaeon]|nr:hypothetical protein [Euryarchaeota archaeon]MAS49208.1 hypothetical protein [Alphaproteobacteria bacterium]|tara:strand:- start:12188 stop:12574 length:387 start_codon:yes stop_codon:yes gene_type:complete
MKNLSILAGSSLLAASAVIASPAQAGPYFNTELNSGFSGFDGLEYVGSVVDVHLGVEGVNGDASWYLQAGPAIVAPDGGDTDVELSGKFGGAVAVTDRFSLYGEVSGMSAEKLEYVNAGLKAGIKYAL